MTDDANETSQLVKGSTVAQSSTTSEATPKLYKRRWVILLLFSISGLLCSTLQMTYAAIVDVVLEYYHFHKTETWKVNLMSLCYLVAFLPSNFVASLAIQRKGIRFAITVGALFNFLCCWIRLIGFHKSSDVHVAHVLYWISFGGQCLGAIGQPFLVSSITQFSVNWFGEKERSLATAIASFLNILGSAVSFGLAPVIVGKGSEVGMTIYLGGQALVCSLMMILTVLFVRERPPTPPSWSEYEKWSQERHRKNEQRAQSRVLNERYYTPHSEERRNEERSNSILKGYLQILTNFNFMILMTAFALGFAVFMSFTTLINQIIIPKGYSDNDAGLFGTLIVASGLLGALIFSVLADLTKRYKLLLLFCGVTALGGFAWFCVVIMYQKTHANYIMCCISIAVMGMHATSVVPLALELAVEMTFPQPESLANGLLYGFGTCLSVICLIVMNAMQKSGPDPLHPGKTHIVSMQNALWLALGLFGLAVGLMVIFRAKYNRLEHERELKKSKIHQES